MPTLPISHLTKEKFLLGVRADSDPTGATVKFALTLRDDEPSSWTAGTWSAASGSSADAITPLIGTGGDITVVKGQTYQAWVQITSGAEVIVERCGLVQVT